MATTRDRQVSFTAGELSPNLWGRTDLPQYAMGARKILNWIVTPHGPLANRPGTQHVATLPGFGRVVPFVFDESDNLILCFTNLKVRVYVPYSSDERHTFIAGAEISTPYTEGHLRTLRFAQVGNVMTIVSEHYTPRELTRVDGSTWTLEETDFSVPAAPAWVGSPLVKHSTTYFFQGDSSHPARDWVWRVTRIMRDSEGRLYETSGVDVEQYYNLSSPVGPYTLPDEIAIYADWPQKINLRYGKTAGVAGDDVLVKSRVYRGRLGQFGYVGEVDHEESDQFTDDGEEPDFSRPPPVGTNPFEVYGGDDALIRTENPSLVAYHENRRLFAATDERPAYVWGSKLVDFTNFDETIPADDEASYSFGLTAKRNQSIRAIVPGDPLLLLTSAGEWLVAGSGEHEVITPNSIAARPLRTEHGSAALEPVVVGNTVFFLQAKGIKPMALVFEEGVRSLDASLAARHLFEGYTVVDWAYAEDPFSVLWVVRSDGKLLSCTYVREHNVLAWAQHDIGGDGLVESVACEPEDSEDAVYLTVNRDGTRSLERFAYRVLPYRDVETEDDEGNVETTRVPDVRYAIHLDRSVSYFNSVTNGLTISDFYSSGGSLGEDVRVSGAVSVAGLALGVGAVIEIQDPAAEGEFLKLALTEVVTSSPPVHRAVPVNKDVPSAYFDFEWDGYLICTNTVTRLDHLEGETVTALVDGHERQGLVVAGGAVSLCEDEDYASYAAIVHVGLPYDSDFESLPLAQERGRQKVLKQTFIELERSRGGAVGSTLDNLLELRTRQVDDAYTVIPARREEHLVPIQDQWGQQGYVAFRQSAPLPCTVLGITREVEHGG